LGPLRLGRRLQVKLTHLVLTSPAIRQTSRVAEHRQRRFDAVVRHEQLHT
jgi:hypothetical protein